MPPSKRRRCPLTELPPQLEAGPPAPPLSFDILLEIVARSDAVTLVRCAASCKPLRRDILNLGFIRRVCHEPGGVVPPCVLGFLDLGNNDESDDEVVPRPPPACFSLAHPATPAAASFSEKHLTPILARNGAANLLSSDVPLISRNGLVLLARGCLDVTARAGGPPYIDRHSGRVPYTYVLLTPADGICLSFLLLTAEFNSWLTGSIKVQTLSGDAAGGAWGPATSVSHSRSQGSMLQDCCSEVVLGGGLIHWLMYKNENRPKGYHILTYDVRTAAAVSIELPTDGLPDHTARCLSSTWRRRRARTGG
ncbi:hypothetical protein C2845_PM02G06760 [Panicum miliaceum]|uniref:F-box domain-containing protein n=1 Tax=Panicum miliaceum TaxID=4540 RepID=A0A3L6S8K0_PANMI|nr:hypothetical protein C2845_PM02G06760 [Panicum miliaceum]